MAQVEHTNEEFINGVRTSFYLQRELEIELNKAVEQYVGTYKSRNHFINCAIVRELRRLDTAKLEIETE